MSTPPNLTDRRALDAHRRRAGRAGVAGFLHDAAAADIEERLAEVNRTFTRPAVVTGAPGLWGALLPGARMVADDDTLDLEPGGHDLVVHAMALHWASDPVGQLVQCRRALRPDGLLLAVLPGGRTLQELRIALAEAESRLRGGLSPRVLPMGEIRDLGALLQRAGLAMPVADSQLLTVSYDEPRALMHDLRAMGETNALAARERAPLRRDVLAEAEALYARRFAAPGGRIAATFELITLTGWAPAETQPQPLRPGSAKARLAEALGTREIGTGDPAAPGQD